MDNAVRIFLAQTNDSGETHEEFIRDSEKEFKLDAIDFCKLSLHDVIAYISELDYLWEK